MEGTVRPNSESGDDSELYETRQLDCSSNLSPSAPKLPVAAILVALLVTLVFAIAAGAAPVPNQIVYDNQLQSFWQDWSWASHNLTQTAVVHGAPNAISWEADVWDGLYFH